MLKKELCGGVYAVGLMEASELFMKEERIVLTLGLGCVAWIGSDLLLTLVVLPGIIVGRRSQSMAMISR
tara:strand:+ start:174 stop:380 length:207 start_codon:yes stop_codon:yes gene_type:complete